MKAPFLGVIGFQAKVSVREGGRSNEIRGGRVLCVKIHLKSRLSAQSTPDETSASKISLSRVALIKAGYDAQSNYKYLSAISRGVFEKQIRNKLKEKFRV